MRVLVVVAHPDDETNGMGGTIAKLAADGHSVRIVVLTTHAVDGARRTAEMMAAARLVGVETPVFLNELDGALVAAAETRERLVGVIGPAPDAVFTLWGVDVHPDHRATASLVLDVFLRKGMNTELFCMEVCASGRSSPLVRAQTLAFRPTHYVDVSSVIDVKRRMQACHASQDPDGMWIGVERMMRNRGAEIGAPFAEAFVRLTRRGPPAPWLAAVLTPTPFDLPSGIGPGVVADP